MNIPKIRKDPIDEEISRLVQKLSEMEPHDKNYVATATNLKLLCEAKGIKAKATVSPDTILSVAGNLAGILLVLNFEKIGIVTSKAFNMIKGNKV